MSKDDKTPFTNKARPASKSAERKPIINIDQIAMTQEQLEEIDRAIPGLADYIRGWAEKAMNAEQSARTDTLTGLPNRLGLEEKAGRILQDVAGNDQRDPSKKQHCTMVFIDTNDFGLINKAMGDSAGDAAIESVGAYFRKTLRSEDFIARKGGDEFVILMRCPEKDAQNRLHELKKDFNDVATTIFRRKLSKLIASTYLDLTPEGIDQMARERLATFQRKLSEKHGNPALEGEPFSLSFSFGTREIQKNELEHIDFSKPGEVSRALSGIMDTADNTMREDKERHRERMRISPMGPQAQKKLQQQMTDSERGTLKF